MQEITQNHHVNLKVATKSKDATTFAIPSVDHPGRKQTPKDHAKMATAKTRNPQASTIDGRKDQEQPLRDEARNPRPNAIGRLKDQAAF